MREPQLVETPKLQPGRCLTCGSIQGVMVDAMVDLPLPDGRVYICVERCLVAFTRLVGAVPLAHHEVTSADLDATRQLSTKLRTQADDSAKQVGGLTTKLKRAEGRIASLESERAALVSSSAEMHEEIERLRSGRKTVEEATETFAALVGES